MAGIMRNKCIRNYSNINGNHSFPIFALVLFSYVLLLHMFIWRMDVMYDANPFIVHNSILSSHEESLTKETAQKLINLTDFSFLMPTPSCSHDVKALILVHSAPQHQQHRDLIRATWGSQALLQNSPILLYFLVGSVLDSIIQKNLINEFKEHGDLLQGSFTDSYYNLTYKHSMALKWFIEQCPYAYLLIKIDDDIFVNTPLLKEYWRNAQVAKSTEIEAFTPATHLFQQPRGLLFCQPVKRGRVFRSYRSKWRISPHLYRYSHYPEYCSGFAIIYSRDVAEELYAALMRSKYFWIDDVFITGFMAEYANITITSSLSLVLTDPSWYINNNSDKPFLFSTDTISSEYMFDLLRKVQLKYN